MEREQRYPAHEARNHDCNWVHHDKFWWYPGHVAAGRTIAATKIYESDAYATDLLCLDDPIFRDKPIIFVGSKPEEEESAGEHVGKA